MNTAVTNGKIASISDTVTFYRDPHNPDSLLTEEQYRDQQAISAQIAAGSTAPEWIKQMRDLLEQGGKEGHSHISIPREYALWLLDHVRVVSPAIITVPEPLTDDQRNAMKEIVEGGTRRSARFDPIERLEQALADDPFPFSEASMVSRRGDMGPDQCLSLYRQDDGDLIVQVACGEGDAFRLAAVEFCTGGGCGGGKSPHSHRALAALMVAIEKDNAERKQMPRL